MRSNIVLVGFMGTGKSSVGLALARLTGYRFTETDAVIEKLADKTIDAIFREDGEIAFRELEIEAVKKLSAGRKQVIACGGGVVLNTINIDRLSKTGVIVLLKAPPSVILRRTSADKAIRPVLKDGAAPAETISRLLKFRQPFYERAGDVTVNTAKGTAEDIARAIMEELGAYEGFNFKK